jgi:hypothetical protein
MINFPRADIKPNGTPLVSSDFDWFRQPLPDLHPEGASTDDITRVFFGPEAIPQPNAWMPDGWLPWNQELLRDLSVAARPTTRREFQSRLEEAAIFDDVGRNLRAWDGELLHVASARLEGENAERTIELYERLFSPEEGRAKWLKQVLQDALDDYIRTTGAQRVVGFELRRYVKNRPNSRFQAYKALEDLDVLFAYHRDLGLTPGEYRPIQHEWLEAIKPEGISLVELGEAIRPSHYVRGSDVLDIFGE